MILRTAKFNRIRKCQYGLTKRGVKNLIDDGCSKSSFGPNNSILTSLLGRFKERTTGNLVLVRHGNIKISVNRQKIFKINII